MFFIYNIFKIINKLNYCYTSYLLFSNQYLHYCFYLKLKNFKMAEQPELGPGDLPITQNRHFEAMELLSSNLPENSFVLCSFYGDEQGEPVDFNPFFGGSVNGDESIIIAALRELREETGLRGRGQFLRSINDRYIMSHGYRNIPCAAKCFIANSASLTFNGFAKMQEEHSYKKATIQGRRVRVKVLILIHGTEDDIRSKVELLNSRPQKEYNDGIVGFCMVPITRLREEYGL